MKLCIGSQVHLSSNIWILKVIFQVLELLHESDAPVEESDFVALARGAAGGGVRHRGRRPRQVLSRTQNRRRGRRVKL